MLLVADGVTDGVTDGTCPVMSIVLNASNVVNAGASSEVL